MSYRLQEAIRLTRSALQGNAWTGKLEKRDVEYAVRKLIDEAESINRENVSLKEKLNRRNFNGR